MTAGIITRGRYRGRPWENVTHNVALRAEK